MSTGVYYTNNGVKGEFEKGAHYWFIGDGSCPDHYRESDQATRMFFGTLGRGHGTLSCVQCHVEETWTHDTIYLRPNDPEGLYEVEPVVSSRGAVAAPNPAVAKVDKPKVKSKPVSRSERHKDAYLRSRMEDWERAIDTRPEQYRELPWSRAEAKQKGLKQFHTGQPCAHNHFSPRFSSSGACIACKAVAQMAKAQNPDPDKLTRAQLKAHAETHEGQAAVYRAKDKAIGEAQRQSVIRDRRVRKLYGNRHFEAKKAEMIADGSYYKIKAGVVTKSRKPKASQQK